jgi:hypothetical protein
MTHHTYTALPRQSLFDIALMTSGSVESALALASLNNLSVTDMPESGHVLNVPADVVRPAVVRHYAVNRIAPATDLSAATFISGIGGIGFWAVDVDFIVS